MTSEPSDIIIAPSQWNSLPGSIWETDSVDTIGVRLQQKQLLNNRSSLDERERSNKGTAEAVQAKTTETDLQNQVMTQAKRELPKATQVFAVVLE